MTLETLALVVFCLAAVPAALTLWNLLIFRPPRRAPADRSPAISVLIPARNEQDNIGAAIESVLASRGVVLEVIVLDDHSDDDTAEVVRRLAARHPEVHLRQAPPLPDGFNGKQHACSVLAGLASNDILVFIDADVRLNERALAELAAHLDRHGLDLLSGFPRQLTGSLGERLLIGLIHVVLLGFLPIAWMRRSTFSGFAAGCGQLMMTRKKPYEQTGGHASIRASRHDGIKLPALYRRHNLKTDIVDATALARCRMYDGFGATWRGLAKNADEGLGAPGRLAFFIPVLLGGQVGPYLLGLWCLAAACSTATVAWSAAALGCVLLPRGLVAWRFRQSFTGALGHPVGIVILLAIQWWALGLKLAGRRITWRGRA